MRERSAEFTAERILAHGDLAGKRVLEVGCGNGRITKLLAEEAASYEAIEPDASCVEEAKANISGVHFSTASGEAMPFEADTFDVVIFTLSLHHQESAKALTEAERVLAKEGVILVVEPLNDGALERVCQVVRDETREKALAQAAITQSGLVVTTTEHFTAIWEFDSPGEVVTWVVKTYGAAHTSELEASIFEIPEVRKGRDLVTLDDTMMLQVLKRP